MGRKTRKVRIKGVTLFDNPADYDLEIKKGGVVLFHGSLAHKSLENTSNLARNAFYDDAFYIFAYHDICKD